MKKLFVTFCFGCVAMYATTLDEVIRSALQSAPSLEVIEARLQANEQNIAIADRFENPEITLTTNTLDKTQAMSQSVVTLKQKIPYYSKREKRQRVAQAEEEVLEEHLHGAKVKLVEKIKEEAYTLWELEKLIKILDDYIELTRQNIDLYESYTSVSNNEHMGIMKAQLSLSNLEVQKTALEAKQQSAYARLSYLAAKKIENLQLSLSIEKKPNLEQLKTALHVNPDLLIRQKEIRKQNAQVELADINNYPDIALFGGYAYRKNFDNYFNVGVGISLPIYGTEDAQEQQQKALLLAKQSAKTDTKLAVEAQIELYYAQMLSSYKIYHIIEDDALAQVAHMFELSSSSISVGSDLFKYIDVLFEKLNLEKKKIEAIANYKRSEAHIAALKGELR